MRLPHFATLVSAGGGLTKGVRPHADLTTTRGLIEAVGNLSPKRGRAPMPTDYKALERQIIAEKATQRAELEASQATAQAKAEAALRDRAKPLTDFLLPELEALRSQMVGKYTVEVAEEITIGAPEPHTMPSVTFEVVSDANGTRSGRVTVRIARLSATTEHGPADGLQVSVVEKGSRDSQDRDAQDLAPTLGLEPRASLDEALALRIVRFAFARVAVQSE